MKEWNEYKSILSEVEEFQKKMAALNNRSKKRLFGGGGKNTAPYTKKPPIARSKSAWDRDWETLLLRIIYFYIRSTLSFSYL